MKMLALLLGSLWSSGALACGNTEVLMSASDIDAPRVAFVVDKLKICDDIDIASLRVAAIMPAHQHGMNYTPTIVELTGGEFRADGMLFHMQGVWEIQVELVQETGVIQYTQTVTLK
jgi:hypothetical protein